MRRAEKRGTTSSCLLLRAVAANMCTSASIWDDPFPPIDIIWAMMIV